jgi:hypothetical protein
VTCHALAYRSTRDDALRRFGRRGDKLLAQLGAEPAWVLDWLTPLAKPPGMHATTYRRLRAEWEAVAAGATEAYLADLQRFAEALDATSSSSPAAVPVKRAAGQGREWEDAPPGMAPGPARFVDSGRLPWPASQNLEGAASSEKLISRRLVQQRPAPARCR